MQPVKSISPQYYAELRTNENPPALLDVRESWEFEITHIEGARLLPPGQIYEWAATLDKNTLFS